MEDNPKVSIIVPVYNVENYLIRCYESIAAQSFKEWEAVFIDDGSTDKSGEICDRIAEKDSRIRVIHKENEGLGLTRNCGVKSSKGKYLFFLDSDDYIEHDAIESLYALIDKEKCDLVIGNFFYQEQIIDIPIKTGLYYGEQIKKELVARIIGSNPGRTDQLTPSSCGKLYKKSIFDNQDIWFPSERKLIWEDLAFNFKYFRSCERIFITDKPVYHYCFNGGSLTHKYDPQKLDKVMKMYRYMKKQLEDTGMILYTKERLNNNFIGHIRTCLKLEAFYDREMGVRNTVRRIGEACSRDDVQSVISSVDVNTFNKSQKVLNWCIKKKYAMAVYLLCKAQNAKKRIE